MHRELSGVRLPSWSLLEGYCNDPEDTADTADDTVEEETGRTVRWETNDKQAPSLGRACHRTVSPVTA